MGVILNIKYKKTLSLIFIGQILFILFFLTYDFRQSITKIVNIFLTILKFNNLSIIKQAELKGEFQNEQHNSIIIDLSSNIVSKTT